MASPSGQTAPMPPMLYGTAWKKERTADLVYEAIKSGFRGIDTAAMKRHYNEAGTGEGINRAISEGIVSRKDLWIQTKFTPGDESLAAHPTIPSQTHASVTASLDNLQTPYLDALVLHSPFPTRAQTLKALLSLKPFLESRQILSLGLSNVPFPVLRNLYESLDDQDNQALCPRIVQNRFRPEEYTWDVETRQFCADKALKYQGFWTLTGNSVWKTAPFVKAIAEAAKVELAEAWYVLLQEEGLTVLNGTTKEAHMRGDLAALEKVRRWRREGGKEADEVWERCLGEFEKLVGRSRR